MIALQVKLNGELLAIAGRNDLCVLNTIIDASGVLGAESVGTKGEKEGVNLGVHVGGLSAKSDDDPGEHLRWVSRKALQIGDEVSVQILEVSEAEEPVPEKRSPKEQQEQIQRNQWESSRAFYLKHKDKYEQNDG